MRSRSGQTGADTFESGEFDSIKTFPEIPAVDATSYGIFPGSRLVARECSAASLKYRQEFGEYDRPRSDPRSPNPFQQRAKKRNERIGIPDAILASFSNPLNPCNTKASLCGSVIFNSSNVKTALRIPRLPKFASLNLISFLTANLPWINLLSYPRIARSRKEIEHRYGAPNQHGWWIDFHGNYGMMTAKRRLSVFGFNARYMDWDSLRRCLERQI
jgi:hypothetical protein